MKYVIGLDLGTTNCKALALSAKGKVLASAESSYPLLSPESGRVEQDAREVWGGVQKTLRAVLDSLPERGDPAGGLAGICLSGAMHSLLPVDASGAPLAPAITWADERAAGQAAKLRHEVDAFALYQRTGCPLESIYYPAKLRWYQEAAPEIFRAAARFTGIKDWICFRLTGAWTTDYGLASTTGLLDIHRMAWDAEALALGGIGADRLPRLVSPYEVVGPVSASQTGSSRGSRSGLPAGIPVIAGSSDGGLANLGAGAIHPGEIALTIGTSGAVRRIVDRPQLDPDERTWCYILDEDRWFAGGAINNGGLALQWVRDRFYSEVVGEAGYLRMLADAAGIPAGAGGVFFLPYFTGERSPYWNSSIRGLLYGLGMEHTRAHVARAVLEGVAYTLADVWEALNETGEPGEARLTGNITRSPLWAQILASVLNLRLIPVAGEDASVFGAAMTGLKALGIATLEETAARIAFGKAYLPDPAPRAVYAAGHKTFQELYRRVGDLPGSAGAS